MRLRSLFVTGFAALLVSPVLFLNAGCNNTDVPLAKEALVQIPEPKAPDAQPKHLRPRSGSSSGMNYDPSGVNSNGPR